VETALGYLRRDGREAEGRKRGKNKRFQL